jgi:hypothetical protein
LVAAYYTEHPVSGRIAAADHLETTELPFLPE